LKEKLTPGTKHNYWICKLAELSHGRGIIIFSNIKDHFDGIYKIQKYICNPLLVGRGFKPLTTYMYQERLVWSAMKSLIIINLQDCYAHLTNSSISKSGASYEQIKEVVDHGCKWTLSQFFSNLPNWDVDDLQLWHQIHPLFWFDLVDDNLKPCFLEVN
ncbi:LOW QUALITY PROTEIN: putative tubulin polyglutamylase TTLL2, partial [Erethizon dorsatum]